MLKTQFVILVASLIALTAIAHSMPFAERSAPEISIAPQEIVSDRRLDDARNFANQQKMQQELRQALIKSPPAQSGTDTTEQTARR